jgi:hypothetical protein
MQTGFANVVMVTPTGAGNHSGNNWENACTIFEAMIDFSQFSTPKAFFGDEFWLKAGTHTIPSSSGIKAICNVLGGFQGNETLSSQRGNDASTTIITSVQKEISEVNRAKLENFTILNSYVSSEYKGIFRNVVFDNATLGSPNSSGNISKAYNCIFKNNTGVASYVWIGGGVSFSDCEFYNNKEGAVQTLGDGGRSSADFYRCIFHDNTNRIGGALYLNSYSKVFNCLFYNNTATIMGGCG